MTWSAALKVLNCRIYLNEMRTGSDISKTSSAGFTLVEIALALLVVAVGIMAVVGILPSAMQFGRDALDDGRMALIADSVLADYGRFLEAGSGGVYAHHLFGVREDGVRRDILSDDGGEFIGQIELRTYRIDDNRTDAVLFAYPGRQTQESFVFFMSYYVVPNNEP